MASVTTDADRQAMTQANEEVRKADEERRKKSGEIAKQNLDLARKDSEETLAEQRDMKPDPSQEEADAIKAGVADPAKRKEVEQPEGPAQRAAQGAPDALTRQVNPDAGGEYKTRSAQSQPKQQPKPQTHQP